MWTIQAVVLVKDAGGERAIAVPTFYLDEKVQGITGETHARQLAEEIINPLKLPDVQVCIVAELN